MKKNQSDLSNLSGFVDDCTKTEKSSPISEALRVVINVNNVYLLAGGRYFLFFGLDNLDHLDNNNVT